MAWAAAIPAVASIAGDLIQGSESNSSSKAAREWEQQMSDTAVQRRVSDMRAAGINPMLSVGGAAEGASTPSTQPASVPEWGRDVSAGASSAMDAYQKSAQRVQMQLENANLEKQGNLLDAQTQNTLAQRDVNAATVGEVGSHQAVNMNTAVNLGMESRNISAEYTKLDNEIHNIILDGDVTELDIKQKKQLYPLLVQRAQLDNQATAYGLPELKAQANADSTMYGQKVKPYVDDLLKAIGTGVNVYGAMRPSVKVNSGASLKAGTGIVDFSTGEILKKGK